MDHGICLLEPNKTSAQVSSLGLFIGLFKKISLVESSGETKTYIFLSNFWLIPIKDAPWCLFLISQGDLSVLAKMNI